MIPLRVKLAVLAGALLWAPAAAAERGVSIDLGRVEITQGMLAGGGYRLPTLGVRNPGDEAGRYRMVISTITAQIGKEPPADWFRFEPATFSLEAGATRAVAARIDLPTGADPGDYEALLGAQLVTEGGGAQVGAEAATHVSFTVEPSSLIAAYWLELKAFLGGHAPWWWLLPLVAVSLAAAAAVRRRFSFSVTRRAAQGRIDQV